jgi:predicted membrane metal-binding protein
MFLSACLVAVFTISFCVFVFLSFCLRCLICPPFRQITFFSEKMLRRVSLRGLQTTESFFALNFFSF